MQLPGRPANTSGDTHCRLKWTPQPKGSTLTEYFRTDDEPCRLALLSADGTILASIELVRKDERDSFAGGQLGWGAYGPLTLKAKGDVKISANLFIQGTKDDGRALAAMERKAAKAAEALKKTEAHFEKLRAKLGR